MEEMIIKKLCTSCICKDTHCDCIEILEGKNYKMYKCLNYKQDISKISPYEKFDYIIRSNNDKIKSKRKDRLGN